MLEREQKPHHGVLVLPLASASSEDVDALLDRAITDFLDTDDKGLEKIRASSAQVLDRVSWERLIGKTLAAHERPSS